MFVFIHCLLGCDPFPLAHQPIIEYTRPIGGNQQAVNK